MIKTRLIPVLYIKNGLIVRSEDFVYHQNIGNVIDEAKRYNDWNVDELIYIDISRDKFYDLRRDDHNIKSLNSIEEIIKCISRVCFMPLAFGGGVRTMEDVGYIIQNGADKVVLNTGAFLSPNLISDVAEKYGSQAVVVSIDYKIIDNHPIVFTDFGKNNTGVSVFEWVKKCEELGAGEIFINTIDYDGHGTGYDIETIKKVVEFCKIPVVACGGAGKLEHFLDLADATNVSGIAAGNLFHFTELSYPRAKKLLKNGGYNFR